MVVDCTVTNSSVGWAELFDGKIIEASYGMYNCAMPGWVIPILFFVLQMMLYFKTRNVTLMWVTGFFFVVMYTTASFIGSYIEEMSIQIMFILLVFELAAILFVLVMK